MLGVFAGYDVQTLKLLRDFWLSQMMRQTDPDDRRLAEGIVREAEAELEHRSLN